MPAKDGSPNGGAPSGHAQVFAPDGSGAPEAVPERDRDAAIQSLTLVVGRLRRGAAALKAENHELRAELATLRPPSPSPSPSRRSEPAATPFGKLAEIGLPKGSGAPGAARMILDHCLTGVVSQRVRRDAALLVSEVVTNSVRHAELADDDTVTLRVYLGAETLRLEIDNPGTAGVVALTVPSQQIRSGGFGLELVDRLASRWGVARAGVTSIWFEMART